MKNEQRAQLVSKGVRKVLFRRVLRPDWIGRAIQEC